jgi:hypothetical protein
MPRKQKTYHYIYKTTNLINGKYYIGMHSTDNPNDGYVGSGKRLWYSIKKYGKENFKCEILEMLPNRQELKEREIALVNENTLKDNMCLNLKTGGEGGICNKEHALRLKEGSSSFQKEKWKDNEYRKKITELLRENLIRNHKEGKIRYDTTKGKNISEEHKRKIGSINSIKQKGTSNSQFGTQWITNGEENKKIKKGTEIPDGFKLGRIK